MASKYSQIITKLGSRRVKLNEPLASYTTFKIGGPADLFYQTKTQEELIGAIKLAREYKIPYFILGGGSNILVSDEGFPGLVIKAVNADLRVVGNKIIAKAGTPTPLI
jgi:UDP-N-acetylmuramate dehydrogenase